MLRFDVRVRGYRYHAIAVMLPAWAVVLYFSTHRFAKVYIEKLSIIWHKISKTIMHLNTSFTVNQMLLLSNSDSLAWPANLHNNYHIHASQHDFSSSPQRYQNPADRSVTAAVYNLSNTPYSITHSLTEEYWYSTSACIKMSGGIGFPWPWHWRRD